ncbi:Bromodomain containing protein [Tritrichomonas foetus]|uniref:Bromodomain containing protein n=1 Tax=Tritrichomonas foetus TaxID=1144522 RepID=A0A1J4JNV3_9EUKA|nr:Bromodomain containing protein [Tritrichomonas foetus]|eukprot:OHS98948.1 Bromodomain containing protein [Tritrichomonas foetus]
MPLSTKRKEKCKEIIHTLLNKAISGIFAQPVDPVLDQCPDYPTIIKKPMDLTTAEQNLDNDVYQTFSDFREDIELIWSNAITYNGKDSIIAAFAVQMRSWFKQLSAGLSDDEQYDWVIKFNQLSKEIDTISGKLAERKIKQIMNPLSLDKKSTSEKHHEGKKSSTLIRSNSNDSLFSDSEPTSPPSSKPKSSSRRPPRPKVNQTEITDIFYRIMGLTDRDTIVKVIETINKEEPQLGINEDSEIDLNTLSMSAKIALKEMFKAPVQQIAQ